jgi:Uncharacterized protein involved in copper resistance
MKNYTLEVCVDTLESAKAAINGGATRLELCSNLVIGGTSPSPKLLAQIREISDIPIRAMLRPRSGDFCYTDSEFDIMRWELEEFRKAGTTGIVCGILSPDGTLDMKRMKTLCDDATGMGKTLHRVFDVAKDPFETLAQTNELGMNTILTSGQQVDAWTGRKLIADLVKKANGIEILAGAGIGVDNIATMHHETGCTSFHLSGKIIVDSPMVFRRNEVKMGLPSLSEFERWQTDELTIRAARDVLEEL